MKYHDTDGDLLRIIAAFFVVAIHAAATAPFSVWSVLYNSLARFSVPIFIMLSGRYMLARRRSIKSLLVKSGSLMLLMLVWSAIYYLYELHRQTQIFSISGTAYYLFTQPIHLWYIYTTIGLYLFTPLFYVFCEHADRRIMQYALLLTFLFGSVITILLRAELTPVLTEIISKMHLDCSVGFIFCYLLGDYLRRCAVKRHGWIYAVGIFGAAVTFVGTLYLSRGNENFLLYSFFAPNVLAASAAVYIGVHQCCTKHPVNSDRVRAVIAQLAGCTLGVYLLHPLILSLLADYIPIQLTAAIDIPARTLCAFALSLVIVLLLRKIPVVRKITG